MFKFNGVHFRVGDFLVQAQRYGHADCESYVQECSISVPSQLTGGNEEMCKADLRFRICIK